MAKTSTHQPTPQPIAVVLVKPHTHKGRDYAVGATLMLDADRADWLINAGAAQLPTADDAKA